MLIWTMLQASGFYHFMPGPDFKSRPGPSNKTQGSNPAQVGLFWVGSEMSRSMNTAKENVGGYSNLKFLFSGLLLRKSINNEIIFE